MAQFYDARGNIYAVVAPESVRSAGIHLPATAQASALARDLWSRAAVDGFCEWPQGTRPIGAKEHRCDGLLVGPFQAAPPFDLLIVNTDGTLAERSGNGLTIFAQALTDQGLMVQTCELRVHHDQPATASPVATRVEPALYEQVAGFWLALGLPMFGSGAVAAAGVNAVAVREREFSHVAALAAINPHWACSQFVRVGNP